MDGVALMHVAGMVYLSEQGHAGKVYSDVNVLLPLAIAASSRIMGLVFPFVYQVRHNKELKSRLNSSIDPLIIPRDGEPAIGLAFNSTFDVSSQQKSHERKIRFGIKMASSYFMPGVKKGIDIGNGMGFSIGLTTIIPFSNIISLNAGADFFHRMAFTHSYSVRSYDSYNNPIFEGSFEEQGLSIPLLARLSPIASVPFHVEAGFQTEFSSGKWDYHQGYSGYFGDYENHLDRPVMDFGFVLGIGYSIYDVGIDARYIIGMSDYSNKYPEAWGKPSQISIGLTRFF
jgi:hypothetical protein